MANTKPIKTRLLLAGANLPLIAMAAAKKTVTQKSREAQAAKQARVAMPAAAL